MGGMIGGVPWYVIPIVVIGILILAYSTITSRAPRFSLTGRRRGSGAIKDNLHLHQAVMRLAQKSGGRLSTSDIAEASGLSQEQVDEVMGVMIDRYNIRVLEEQLTSPTYEFPDFIDRK